jgi:hypothetical protein
VFFYTARTPAKPIGDVADQETLPVPCENRVAPDRIVHAQAHEPR